MRLQQVAPAQGISGLHETQGISLTEERVPGSWYSSGLREPLRAAMGWGKQPLCTRLAGRGLRERHKVPSLLAWVLPSSFSSCLAPRPCLRVINTINHYNHT